MLGKLKIGISQQIFDILQAHLERKSTKNWGLRDRIIGYFERQIPESRLRDALSILKRSGGTFGLEKFRYFEVEGNLNVSAEAEISMRLVELEKNECVAVIEVNELRADAWYKSGILDGA